mmetsp:Transcript_57535/g.69214  ORF Transcript_57535/g.69214 Transcript_57535/m.69214 type:complete len:522 (+) Transcript_57535:361-1926(+)
MESWAEQCDSSDEEAIAAPHSPHHKSQPFLDEDDSSSDEYDIDDHDASNSHHHGGGSRGNQPQRKQQNRNNLPSHPPFVAFIGNIPDEHGNNNQSIKPDDLSRELEKLVKQQSGVDIVAKNARIVSNRKNGGCFGYVEFATVENLAAVLELDGRAQLFNRRIRVDVANQNQLRGPPPNNNNNSNLRRNVNMGSSNNGSSNNPHRSSSGPTGDMRRASSHGSLEASQRHGAASGEKVDGSNFQGGRFNKANRSEQNMATMNEKKKDEPSRRRPMLKLAPRTLPLEPGRKATGSIFGEGTARDVNKKIEKIKEGDESVGGAVGESSQQPVCDVGNNKGNNPSSLAAAANNGNIGEKNGLEACPANGATKNSNDGRHATKTGNHSKSDSTAANGGGGRGRGDKFSVRRDSIGGRNSGRGQGRGGVDGKRTSKSDGRGRNNGRGGRGGRSFNDGSGNTKGRNDQGRQQSKGKKNNNNQSNNTNSGNGAGRKGNANTVKGSDVASKKSEKKATSRFAALMVDSDSE